MDPERLHRDDFQEPSPPGDYITARKSDETQRSRCSSYRG